MFNVVSSKKHDEFREDVEQMFDRLRIVYGDGAKDDYDHNDVIYVLYSHKKFGVIGSARLIPAGSKALTEEYMRRIKCEGKNKVYELSRVFFHIPQSAKVKESSEMLEIIKRDFYLGLYEALKTISISQKVKTFITVLTEEEHKAILQYGMWPFQKQGRVMIPKSEAKVYALGILPMSEPLYETFLTRRQAYESRMQHVF